MVEIEVQSVSKSYGSRTILEDLNLSVAQGRFSVVLGAPVSGKSVLMRLLMGLEFADEGRILLHGREVTKEPAGSRNFGYVPQSFALYPHCRVFDNIAYPLTLAKRQKNLIRERVTELARKLKIEHLLQKFPNQLSGGEKQRVALARGMIKDSAVFILDDPLVGLDFKLREQLFIDLREMLSEVEGSVIYATSDPLETLALADDVFVLDKRTIVECGPVDQVYELPQQVRSLQLTGVPMANLCEGELVGDVCQTPFGSFPVDRAEIGDSHRKIQLGFRPEAVRLEQLRNSPLCGAGVVLLQEDLGAETLLYFESAGLRLVTYWSNGAPPPIAGENFRFEIDPALVHVFDASTGFQIRPPARAGALQAAANDRVFHG
jgi:ABC-type sugar transport system ATPase subunit